MCYAKGKLNGTLLSNFSVCCKAENRNQRRNVSAQNHVIRRVHRHKVEMNYLIQHKFFRRVTSLSNVLKIERVRLCHYGSPFKNKLNF